MAVINMQCYSAALNKATKVNIILPLARDAALPVRDLPLLMLLHGMGDNADSWLNKTGIERYALDSGLAVAMPDGDLSCYEDMAHGARYRSYIAEELPRMLRAAFPLSRAREKNFIAGCSMGGFGALKIGLSQPQQYAAIGCFSAAHMEYRPDSPRVKQTLVRVYGGDIDACDQIIVADAGTVNAGDRQLKIWHACGSADYLSENAHKTQAFFTAMAGGAIDYHFTVIGQKHDWNTWDAMAAAFIPALGLPAPEVRLL